MSTTGPVWPLFFDHRSLVVGRGFLADVRIAGRLLARLEVEGVWFDGVNPGALAFGATTVVNGSLRLREALTAVLEDFAQTAAWFDDFKATVEAFVHETDEASIAEWAAAVETVRQNRGSLPADLPILSATRPVAVSITSKPLTELTPEDNTPASEDRLVAAACG